MFHVLYTLLHIFKNTTDFLTIHFSQKLQMNFSITLLCRGYSRLNKYHIRTLVGDVNAKIGREHMYKDITGGKSKHQMSNNNNQSVTEFTEEKGMKIITHFRRKDTHKGTWMASN